METDNETGIISIHTYRFPNDTSFYLNTFRCVLAHLRWKLKWDFLIACCPLSICLLTFHIFMFFSRSTGPILTKIWYITSLSEGNLWVFFQMKDRAFLKRGYHNEIAKIHILVWRRSKVSFHINDCFILNSYKGPSNCHKGNKESFHRSLIQHYGQQYL